MIVSQKANLMLKAVREDAKSSAEALIAQIKRDLDPIETALTEDALQGTDRERAKLDRSYAAQTIVSRELSALQETMVPAGYRVCYCIVLHSSRHTQLYLYIATS
jgi:hypothetical protein